jgi:DNA-directed RNA polymerase specialized sigma subunit
MSAHVPPAKGGALMACAQTSLPLADNPASDKLIRAAREHREEMGRERALVFAAKWKYTARELGIVQLYYTCGLSHCEIARIFNVRRPSISRSMQSVRRKANLE